MKSAMSRHLLCQTSAAEPVDLEDMRKDLALHALDHQSFYLFFSAEMEVLDLIAENADKVMVMLFIPAEVIVELPVRMEHAGYDVAFMQLLKNTVHGRQTDAPEPLLHLFPDRLRAQVHLLGIQNLQQGNPLWC